MSTEDKARREFERELYIFGEPQEFWINEEKSVKFRFLTYKEYLLNNGYLSLISQNVLHLYYQYRKVLDTKDEEVMEELEKLKKESLYNIVLQSPDLISSYLKIISLKLDALEQDELEDIIPLLFENEDVFMRVRTLIMDMEMLVESEVNPNPEVQRGIELSRELKSQNNKDAPGVIDILTSIVAGTSVSFERMQNMTAIQVNSIYQRIGAFKNYDTSILFATVSPDVSIESWNKRIDLYERESSSISRQEFDKNYGSLLN